ncbi:MAG: nucleotide exchange factor GrpE [Thermoplasmatota archaeon]
MCEKNNTEDTLNEKDEASIEEETDISEELEELKEEIEGEPEEPTREQLEEEIEDLRSSLKKVMADFDNFRKRKIKERKQIIERATEGLMIDLLDVLDDFERALDEDDFDKDGVEMIYRKFYKTLKNHGLEEIDAHKEEFDPYYHECVMSVEVDEEENKNKVLEQFEKGYKLKSKVIRPAKVKVGK